MNKPTIEDILAPRPEARPRIYAYTIDGATSGSANGASNVQPGATPRVSGTQHLINSVADHVHILFELARTVSVSQAVEEVKKSSSKWMKTQGAEFVPFAWQAGYGAFAVSESNVRAVRDYIARQQEHHGRKSFEDEYRAFLERHGVAYDEQYVWD